MKNEPYYGLTPNSDLEKVMGLKLPLKPQRKLTQFVIAPDADEILCGTRIGVTKPMVPRGSG